MSNAYSHIYQPVTCVQCGEEHINQISHSCGLPSLDSVTCPDCGASYQFSQDHECGSPGTTTLKSMGVKAPTEVPRSPREFHRVTQPSTQIGGTHYESQAIQPIEYINANNLNYHQGNILKYITRYRSKNGVEDLRKAMWYLEDLIKVEYPNSI